jgi:hypothetical protein
MYKMYKMVNNNLPSEIKLIIYRNIHQMSLWESLNKIKLAGISYYEDLPDLEDPRMIIPAFEKDDFCFERVTEVLKNN